MSLMSLWRLQLWVDFIHCSGGSLVDFEQKKKPAENPQPLHKYFKMKYFS